MSEHLWAVNMLRGPKNILNQNASILIVFFDQYEKKAARKILS